MNPTDNANHVDNQRRLASIEEATKTNTEAIEKLVESTHDLLEMWGDASVFFKWMRRFGSLLMWVGKVAAAIAALFGIAHYWGPK